MPANQSDHDLSHVSDQELWRQMCGGNERAFLALYRRRQGGIYRFALRMSGSEAVAEDVTQEVFLILMRGDGQYHEARGSFSAYMFGIARNQVLRRLEKERSFLPILSGLDDDGDWEANAPENLPDGLIVRHDPLGDLSRQETIAAVRQAVLSLPPHYREVVVLCDLQEVSYQDAAAALSCAVGTVRSRLHRGRALLMERLRKDAVTAPASWNEAAQCLV